MSNPASEQTKSTADGYVVAVVGATGLVGRTMISVLEERNFPVRRLVPLAAIEDPRLRYTGFERRPVGVTQRHGDGLQTLEILFKQADARFGFTPLYTTHDEVAQAVAILAEIMAKSLWDTPEFKTRKKVT